MSGENWARVWAIFEQSLDLPAADRGAFLAETCGDDARLQRAVERMLAADQGADSLLDRPLLGPLPEAGHPVDRPWQRPLPAGQTIGPYRILRRIGQGGMGVVYLAVRADDAYKRQVVIKLVRAGMESRAVVERLRTERQILAALDHPSIARLYDGGTTDEGLPYFVMEYIEGMPIDAYCEHNELTLDDRLRLFRKVCEPVHYAHQNLVVHRDIKPSNILVTAGGEPKLLDFGIAKLLNPDFFAGGHEPTATWQRVLTPNYASPEQIRGRLVTTASDVYSLGVLLYKLLTGHLPRQLAGRSVDEIESLLTASEPLPPSIAVTRPVEGEAAGAASSAASPRPVEAGTARRSRQLAGDLDAILLKALRTAPRQRYGSVEQLAADAERYQLGMPVLARSGSWRYRAGKFVRRHRRSLAAASILAALVVGLIVATLLQSSRVAFERDQARSERDKKAAVLSLVRELFRVGDPYVAPGEDLTVREALERSVPVLDNRLHDQPEVRAELLQTSGSILGVLGAYRIAREQLSEAFEIRQRLYGDEHPSIAESMAGLAAAYKAFGEYDRAESLARQAVDMSRRLLPAGDPALVRHLNELSSVMCYRNEFGLAEEPAAQAVALARDLPADSLEREDALIQLAAVRNAQGAYREAARLRREAVASMRQRYGEQYPGQIVTLNNLALSLRRLGELEAAERVYQEALSLQQVNFGDERPNAPLLANFAGVRYAKGEFASAEELYRQARAAVLARSGPDHWRIYSYELRIARARIRQGAAAEAEDSVRRLLDHWRPKLGDEHWRIQEGLGVLGESLSGQGRCAEAEELLVDSFEQLLAKARDRTRQDAFGRLREHLERCGEAQRIARFEAQLAAALSPGQ